MLILTQSKVACDATFNNSTEFFYIRYDILLELQEQGAMIVLLQCWLGNIVTFLNWNGNLLEKRWHQQYQHTYPSQHLKCLWSFACIQQRPSLGNTDKLHKMQNRWQSIAFTACFYIMIYILVKLTLNVACITSLTKCYVM